MANARFRVSKPANEPVLAYAPASPERTLLTRDLARQARETLEIPLIIGGRPVTTGDLGRVVMPHDHGHLLARYHKAGPQEVRLAIAAAQAAREGWEELPWSDRAAIFLKAAQLISTRCRMRLNAATMLNQSKNVIQAEIDSACELADFLRFNAYFLGRIYAEQPAATPEALNRLEYRGLEGFVFAATPFNFTAIAGNLPTAPALMGNTVVWKPASSAVLSGWHLMQLFQEAGFPDGVVNFVPGDGPTVGAAALADEALAGIHFTGSTAVFQGMWRTVGARIAHYRSYPRLVGETGGKDFVVAHPSADPAALCTALVRGAFEYQGQKCSAASRAYIPASLWDGLQDRLAAALEEIRLGDPRDFGCFMNALIDEAAFERVMGYIHRAGASNDAEILFGGSGDKTRGYFIAPTVVWAKVPDYETMTQEIFGPLLSLYRYPDDGFAEILGVCDRTSPYALTGALFARDRAAIALAERRLRHAAGNFYINDKPTGAVVGQQPFGGGRASGTNDKAGWHLNLLRWTSARTIKETFCPPIDFRYPFMGPEKIGPGPGGTP